MMDRRARGVLFLGFGDVHHSLGARVYLSALIMTTRALSYSVRAYFLQQTLPGVDSALAQSDGMTTIPFPSAWGRRYVPGILWRVIELIWANRQARRIVAADAGRSEVCIVTGAALLPLSRMFRRKFSTLVYVHHGIAEEFLSSPTLTGRVKYGLFKRFERTYLRLFDTVIVVSEKMHAYVRQEYGITRSAVIPCAVDLGRFRYSEIDRLEMREELGVAGRVVFVYSGGSAGWQCLRETVRLFRRIQAVERAALLLILSRDTPAMRREVEGLNPDDYRLVSVPHEDVGRYLRAADVGFLLRKRSIINTVASPVKFPEYLASGLLVISSPGIGDYSALIERDQVGVLLDPEDELTWAPALDALALLLSQPQVRERCPGVAQSLSWDAVAPSLARALTPGKVVGSPAVLERREDTYVHQ